MHVEFKPDESGVSRPYQWGHAASDPTHRYYDFKKSPELVRTSLEDFKPQERWPAVQRFYGLLEWLNGPDSHLESNDCAFWEARSPKPPKPGFTHQCDGRLMVLFRDLDLNRNEAVIRWLLGKSTELLRAAPGGPWGKIALSISCCHFEDPPRSEAWQVTYFFWAWGNGEEQAMARLDEVFAVLESVLREIAKRIGEGEVAKLLAETKHPGQA